MGLIPDPEIKLHLKITSIDLKNTRDWLLKLHAALPQTPEPRPFLLISPYGVALREELMELLAAQIISIGQRVHISDWPRASIAIYAKTLEEERLRVALGFEALWRSVSLTQAGERWDLATPEDYPRLMGVRVDLRTVLGTRRFQVQFPGVRLRSQGIVRLQAFHVPDLDSLGEESRLIDAYLHLL